MKVSFVLHLGRHNKHMLLLQKRAGRKEGERRILQTAILYGQKEQKLGRNFKKSKLSRKEYKVVSKKN